MHGRHRLAAAALAVLAATRPASAQQVTPAPAKPVAELKDGRWQAVPDAPASQPTPDADLDHMDQLLKVGDAKAARNVGIDWVKAHDKKAANRDRAILLLAQANFKLDDRLRAYYYLDELMDEYPASPLFAAALDQQYRIAEGYLAGHKDSILGLPLADREEEAVEMLYRIQQRSPGSPLAQKALLRTADYYFAHGEYALAHDAYTFYVKNYPRAETIPQVKLRQAFSSLAQFKGPQFDASPIQDARAELGDIAAAYPQLAREENIAGIIERIDQEMANKLFIEAGYYRRTGRPVGAVYVYRYLIETYPNADKVPAARAALAEMPKSALARPDPKPGSPYQPAAAGGR